MCHCRHFVILFFTTARHLDLAQSLPISLHNQECSPFCIWSSSQLSFTFTQTPLYSVPSISLPSIQICTAKTNRSQLCLHSLCIIFKYFPLAHPTLYSHYAIIVALTKITPVHILFYLFQVPFLHIMCHFKHSILLDYCPHQGLISSVSVFFSSPPSPFLWCGTSGVLSYNILFHIKDKR